MVTFLSHTSAAVNTRGGTGTFASEYTKRSLWLISRKEENQK